MHFPFRPLPSRAWAYVTLGLFRLSVLVCFLSLFLRRGKALSEQGQNDPVDLEFIKRVRCILGAFSVDHLIGSVGQSPTSLALPEKICEGSMNPQQNAPVNDKARESPRFHALPVLAPYRGNNR